MEKPVRKVFFFTIFLLILLIQKSKAKSSENDLSEDFKSLVLREIGMLKQENLDQDLQIELTKEFVGLKNINSNHQNEQQKMKLNPLEDHQGRHKRLYRLLPLNDHTKNQKVDEFYGPATNCFEVSRLGYTLNGYYHVKANNIADINQIETVYCQFKQPEGIFDPSGNEKRIVSSSRAQFSTNGFMTKRKETNTLPGAVSPTNQVSSTSQNEEPVHSSQTSLKMNENFFQTMVNFNSETQKSDKSIKPSMDFNQRSRTEKSTTKQEDMVTTASTKKTDINVISGAVSPKKVKLNQEIPPNPSLGHQLMNDNGKCLAVETTGTINPDANGAKIIHAKCDPSEKGQLWKYDEGTKLLCNDWGKCLSIPFGVRLDPGIIFDLIQWEPVDGQQQKRQKWFQSSNQFRLIGMCLAFRGYNNPPGAIRGYCYKKDGSIENGTIWNFVGN